MAAEGTKENSWKLKTPLLTSGYEVYKDEKGGKAVIFCVIGKTTLMYDCRCRNDLRALLQKHGDWMKLGSANEQKPAKEGAVEAWGRSDSNSVGS